MHQVNLLMKDSGLMISFKVKVHCTMRNHKCYLVILIMEISIKLESMYFESNLDIGPNILGNSMRIIKRDKEHYICQMVINLKAIFFRT